MLSGLFKEPSKTWTPRAYMKKGVKWLLERFNAGLLLDPGMGKTSITLAALLILKKKKLLKRALILAPVKVCYATWPDEVAKWSDFKDFSWIVMHGPEKNKALQMMLDEDIELVFMNYEGLQWLLGAKVTTSANGKKSVTFDKAKFRRLGFNVLVIDELSKFKHSGSNRSKLLKQAGELFDYRWGLTGSPAANGIMDLFGEMLVLDHGRSLGRFITHFRYEFFDQPRDYLYVPKAGALDKIKDRLAGLCLALSADDYLDLPKLVENDVFVTLPDSVMPLYKELAKELSAQFDQGLVTAANAAVKSGKCRQVASGSVYVDQEHEMEDVIAKLKMGKIIKRAPEYITVHDEKLEALTDLIGELNGTPVLVVYEFNHSLARIQKALGGKVPAIKGGMSPVAAKEVQAAWNRGDLPVLLGQPAAMAYGLNLQFSGNHIILFDMIWDFELYDQVIRRIRRQGSTHDQVFVHRLIAAKTVDVTVARALSAKENVQRAVFEALG